MAAMLIPARHPIARAAAAWPTEPHNKPSIPMQIDWDNPLTQALSSLVISTGGWHIDLMDGHVGQYGTVSVGSYDDRHGQSTRITRGTPGAIQTNAGISTTGGYSCVVTFRALDISFGNTEYLASTRDSVNRGWSLYLTGASGSAPNRETDVRLVHGGVAAYTLSDNQAGLDNTIVTIGLSVEASSEARAYLDGGLIGSASVGILRDSDDLLYYGEDLRVDDSEGDLEIFVGATWDRSLSAAEQEQAADLYTLLKPANQSPFLVTAPAGTSFAETSQVTAAAAVSAVESYAAPAYTETASVTAAGSVDASESYAASGFIETAAIVATAVMEAAETYTGPGYDETAAISATASVSATEQFSPQTPAYAETAQLAASPIVSAVEAYSSPSYPETAVVSAAASVVAAEQFTPPAPAYSETAQVATTATIEAVELFTPPDPMYAETAQVVADGVASASETYTGPVYTEAAAVSASALVAASEIYVGPLNNETATITAAAMVSASEVYAYTPPSYDESALVSDAAVVSASETFSTPLALPSGINVLSARLHGGYYARKN